MLLCIRDANRPDFGGMLPGFLKHFCPFRHLNLATLLFLASLLAIEVASNVESLPVFCLNPYFLDVKVGFSST